MGKQINFYLSENDVKKIETYLSENDFSIFKEYAKESKDLKVTSLLVNEDETDCFRFIVPNILTNEIKLTHYQQDEQSIDRIYSPIIEFNPPHFSRKSNTLSRGRFYYETAQLSPEIASTLEQTAQKLFRWFKRNFKQGANPIFHGAYTSENVLDLMKSVHTKILLNWE